jgi:hypothetical protein
MGLSPAWFPISSQRIGGVHGEPNIKGGLHKPTFFSIIHSIEFMIL